MPNALSYQLHRLGSRLHRMRLALHARGWRGLARRLSHGATPGMADAPRPASTRPSAPAAPATPRDGAARILVVDVTTPRPDRDSGSQRAFNLMRLLADAGHAVDFLPDDGADAGRYTDALRATGVRVLLGPGIGGFGWLRRHLADYAAIVASRYHLAEALVPLARSVAPDTVLVLDTVDLHFLREQREAELRGDRTLLRLSHSTRRRELGVISSVDATWVVSDAERVLLQAQAPGARVHVVPNILEPIADVAPPAGRHGLLFVGGSGHPPNVDAIAWLLDDIVPRLATRLPGCTLHVAGPGTAELVAGRAPGRVVAHGHVADLSPLLSACRAGVAPLRFGAGVKGKVNLYMAHGLPCVATACAAEGMHLRDGEDALIADDADAFVDAIARLHGDDGLWATLSANGRRNVQRHFSFEAAREAVAATFAKGR